MVAAAAESSLTLSIKVPSDRACYARSIKVSVEMTSADPPSTLAPLQPGLLGELFIALSVLSYVFLKQSSHFFQVNCKNPFFTFYP